MDGNTGDVLYATMNYPCFKWSLYKQLSFSGVPSKV